MKKGSRRYEMCTIYISNFQKNFLMFFENDITAFIFLQNLGLEISHDIKLYYKIEEPISDVMLCAVCVQNFG